MTTPSIRGRQWALLALIFIPGISMASWVTRTPAIRDHLGASTAQMGLILFGLSIGSMVGILSSGALVARFGARAIAALGTVAIVAAMPIIGVGTLVDVGGIVALGLFFFGAGMGSGEVALNVEGAAIESLTRKTFLPLLHGFFSFGTVIGAAAGIAATAVDFDVVTHLVIVGVVTAALCAVSIRKLPPGTGRVARRTVAGEEPGRTSRSAGALALLRDRRLLCIGYIVLAMALAEGTANDWLPLLMVDGHGFAPAMGSTVYLVFAIAMTAGRFCGGAVVDRYGRAPVLAASAVSGAIGLAVVAFVDVQWAAMAAVVFWGLGASLGFPVALSAAGSSGRESVEPGVDADADAAARVSIAATIGYLAFLAGPPTLGVLGEDFGLRNALVVPLIAVAAAIAAAPALRGRSAEREVRLPDDQSDQSIVR